MLSSFTVVQSSGFVFVPFGRGRGKYSFVHDNLAESIVLRFCPFGVEVEGVDRSLLSTLSYFEVAFILKK